jgi:hypothetical protein
MIQSIPASQIVSAIPSVLGAGGNPLSPNGVLVDNSGDTSIPIGVAQGFPNLLAVEDWYGANSIQATLAEQYFSGFNGANQLPGVLYFYQYNDAAASAYLRSGELPALSVLVGYSGDLIIDIDGAEVTSAAINLAGATSQSNAAALIQTALQTTGGIFSGTATLVTATPTMTVASTVSGELHIGDVVVGTDIPAATTITAFGTYTTESGVGTVTLSQNATATVSEAEAVTVSSDATVTYDALRNAFVVESGSTGANSSVGFATGTLSADVLLTSATGAVQSIGAAAATPAGAMNGVVASTQNWVTFATVDDPDEPGVYTNKLAFSAWTSAASPAGQERFTYVGWDPNKAPGQTANLTDCFGSAVKAAGYNGTYVRYDLQSGAGAAFVMGCAACIDVNETQGRITFAFKTSTAGLAADVTDATTAANLQSNGYNYYGTYGTANQQFTFEYPGSMPGPWKWADAYIDQILMNSAFQLAIMSYLTSVKSLPYNSSGYAGLRAALLDPITQFLNFGAIQPGVALSQSQIQQINTAAGNSTAAQTIAQTGWYLQILPANAQTRGNRTSPPMTFWYTDGGSIQQVQLASIDVQ